jgi:hypothetical protein
MRRRRDGHRGPRSSFVLLSALAIVLVLLGRSCIPIKVRRRVPEKEGDGGVS